VRVAHSAALAGLEGTRLAPALAQVRMLYELCIRSYKRLQARRQCPTQDPAN